MSGQHGVEREITFHTPLTQPAVVELPVMGNGLLYPREGLADVLQDTFPDVPPRRARVVQRKSPDGDLTILVHQGEGNGYDLRGRVLLQEAGVFRRALDVVRDHLGILQCRLERTESRLVQHVSDLLGRLDSGRFSTIDPSGQELEVRHETGIMTRV